MLARRDDGKAVFIPYAVPGDKLLVQSFAEKKNYIRAEILEILTAGTGRIKPACQYFGKCGGCNWQQIEYSRQVEAKRRILEELFHHRFPETKHLAITMQPCPMYFGYRSRVRLRRHVGDKIAVGFFRAGSHIVEDIEYCPLLRPRLNEILPALRPISFHDEYNDIQEIDIACSEKDVVWSTAKGGGKPGKLLQRKVGEFTYNVVAGAFFQANDFMIDALVSHVMDCTPQNSGNAIDLFSGAGLFSLPLARRFSAVTAVEYSRMSHKLCEMNANAAGIKNIEAVCADVAGWLNLRKAPRFDCIVLDPPRTGADTGVMEQIDRLSPATIVYVSCNPQTLVRDLERLNIDCWRIVSVAGFDMFPQTHHFETVVHLHKWTQ